MKSAVALASAALLVSGALAQKIETPNNVQQCRPTLLTWSGGSPPYIVDLVPGNQPGAAAIAELASNTNDVQLTWRNTYPAGTVLGLNLRDSLGALGQSAAFTVLPGGDQSCLSSTASGSSSAAAPSSTSTTTTVVASSAPAPSSTASSASGSISSALSSASVALSSASSVLNSATGSASASSASRSSSASSASNTSSAPAASSTGSNSGAIGVSPTGLLGFVGAVAALLL